MWKVSAVLAAPIVGQDVFLGTKVQSYDDFQWGWDDESPLDTYVNKPDPNFKWSDTSVRVPTILGGKGHLLNVTSQQWLDESRAYGPNGAIWTHQVLTIVPRHIKIKNKAVIYITGGCNENPDVPKATDEEPLAMDAISAQTGAIGVVLNQIPNCHMHYPSDPSGKGRSEDSMIAWAWHQFLETGDPEWLPRLPMVKAAMKAMQAVQEYTKEAGIADIDGWLVAGASKRGWTTWMVGAVNCPSCPTIDAIAPIVPIVPNLRAGVHHMWQAYGGFTFAFNDYTDVNLTTLIDDEKTINLFKIVDPIHYIKRLERLPKSVLVSGGDEFMMFEWTRLWWDKFTGEKHLYIADNAEHSYATGIVGLLKTLGNFANSVYLNGTRPSFDWDLDLEKGEINVRLPEGQEHGKVVLRHSHTMSLKRRDFRLAVKADEVDGKANCKLPLVGPISMDGSDICGQPVIWIGTDQKETSPGVYNVKVPRPQGGIGWVGAYVEVYFPSDTGLFDEYQFTTTGMVWPQRMPFEPCEGSGCKPNLV